MINKALITGYVGMFTASCVIGTAVVMQWEELLFIGGQSLFLTATVTLVSLVIKEMRP